MMLTKAEVAAKTVLSESGLDDITVLPTANLRRLILSRGAYYEEIDLKGKDGRIVSANGKSIISLNSRITDRGKKRFAAAHELGHFELHKNLALNFDSQYDLCNWYQAGIHEREANEFAAELLMPTGLFKAQCTGRKIGTALLNDLATTFAVTKTAAILKFVKSGHHPVCVVCTHENRVKWWRMSKEMEETEHHYIPGFLEFKFKLTSSLPPPTHSVVGQMFAKTNSYTDRLQEIDKSTWFLTKPEDDYTMFEFCHFLPSYNFALSVIWAD